MNWQGKKVLVTGGGGFIGSHLTERLVEMGADVRATVHYNALGRWGWLDESPHNGADNLEVMAADISDAWSVKHAMEGREVVFHLAALIAIPYSYVAPASYVRTNIDGTLNVLQAARDLGTARVVHTSTSEVYGTALRAPIDEEHPLQGQSPYSATKIAADKLAESYYRSFDVPVVTARPFNTFGPRQSARAVIPTIIAQCLAGNTVKLGNLDATRDLNYVANTVDGFIKCAESDAALGEAVNLGSGREISIGDLATMIGKLVGKEIEIITDQQRLRPEKSEVNRLLAANEKAKELLNWEPGVALEQGMQHTIDWFRDNADKYRANVYNI